MGRELKRVPLDFYWPLNQVWQGYLQPESDACRDCPDCEGGYSAEAKRLERLWYGYLPFRPEDRGSTPFEVHDRVVWDFARRNVLRSPEFYGVGHLNLAFEAEFDYDARKALRDATTREAQRLLDQCVNNHWSHHLNQHDVDALLEAGQLKEMTHDYDPEARQWVAKVPAVVPSPREVNAFSISNPMGLGNALWYCQQAECKRLGVPVTCQTCQGEAVLWASPEAKAEHEAWQATPPPEGEGYQIWETVSEGSPISPVFAEPEALAEWMATHPWNSVDRGTTAATWLAFIRGPGWAPSLVVDADHQVVSGVEAAIRPE